MADINFIPGKGSIGFQVEVTTPQVVGYQITVIDPDGNTELEHYVGSQATNPYQVTLPKPAGSYDGCYISGTFVIIDPEGAGNNYNLNFSIRQGGYDLKPVQNIKGKTVDGKLPKTAIFHLHASA